MFGNNFTREFQREKKNSKAKIHTISFIQWFIFNKFYIELNQIILRMMINRFKFSLICFH